MSNRQARRERKLKQRTTGEHYQHPVKVGTPFLERAFVTNWVVKPDGKRGPRSESKVARWLKDRGIVRDA